MGKFLLTTALLSPSSAAMNMGSSTNARAKALSALKWLADAGIDTLVEDQPQSWLAAAKAQVQARLTPEPSPAPIQAEPSEAPKPTSDLSAIASIEALSDFIATSDAVPLRIAGAAPLLRAGTPGADLMLLADMPGAAEQRGGAAFSDEAGRLLDRMLAAIKRDRNTAYLANFCAWRTPSAQIAAGRDRDFWTDVARRHIALAAPESLLLLGNLPCQALLGLDLAQARGRWHQLKVEGRTIPAIASFTPAWLLRQPAHKALAWADLQLWQKGPSA